MAGTNDFLPFATEGADVNVQPQGTYAGSSQQQDGYEDGEIPDANNFNKAVRQGTRIASALAQVVCNFLNLDMFDNDDNQDDLVENISKLIGRVRLQADTTFYVSTAGNDATGDGSVGAPWRTVQHAVNVIHDGYDLAGFVATITRAAGAYTDTVLVNGPFVGAKGPEAVIFDGVGMAIVTVTNAVNGVSIYQAQGGAQFTVQNQKLVQAGSGAAAINVFDFGSSVNYTAVDFAGGSAASNHMSCTGGGQISGIGDYKISGGATAHMGMGGCGLWSLTAGITVTTAGVPAWGNSFVYCRQSSSVSAGGVIFAGSGATGNRYEATLNGVIDTTGGGANYFPGNASGTTATGGQYA